MYYVAIVMKSKSKLHPKILTELLKPCNKVKTPVCLGDMKLYPKKHCKLHPQENSSPDTTLD